VAAHLQAFETLPGVVPPPMEPGARIRSD
jgi:hypothetical protein